MRKRWREGVMEARAEEWREAGSEGGRKRRRE